MKTKLPSPSPYGHFTVPAVTPDRSPRAVQIMTLDVDEVIKSRNEAAGLHFFDAAALRFFRSRISAEAYEASTSPFAFFVTSEQFKPSRGEAYPRKYTVRVCDVRTGSVNTFGDFNSIATAAQARAVAKRAAMLSAYVAAGYGTAPTADGRDVDIFAELLTLAQRAKEREAEAVNA